MKRDVFSAQPIRLASISLASLMIAGACSVTPGLALADAGTSASGDVPGAVAVSAVADGSAVEGSRILSFAGVRVDVSLAMEVLELPDASMVTAALPEGGLSVAITDFADEGTAVPENAAEQEEFFTADAEALAAALNSQVTSSEVLELADGTSAYLYEIDEAAPSEGGLAGYFAFVYVPTGEGAYACVQITCIGEDIASYQEDIDAMIASITHAEADEANGAAGAPAAEFGRSVQATGVAFDLPEDLEATEIEGAGDELAAWSNADGSLTVRAVGDAMPQTSDPSADEIAQDVEDLVAIMDGKVDSGAVLWNADAIVWQYVTTYEFEGVQHVTTYGCVVLDDGMTTYVICDCTADDYEQYAATIDAIYVSMTLA